MGGKNSHQRGANSNLILIIDKNYAFFDGDIKVNGSAITRGTDYTDQSGSTVITLLASYLNSLSAGAYTLTVAFNDGTEAVSTFNITEAGSTPSGGGGAYYTVTYETNGGGEIKSQSAVRSSKITKPADPAKDGFSFAGWYLDKELTTEYDFNQGVTSNITLYAKWTVKNPFIDVKPGDWHYDAVMYVYEKGLMLGVSDELFDPNGTLTRAMIATILYRHAGSPDVSGLENPFTDVPEGKWYTSAVKWAYANGIAMGYGYGLFGIDDPVTKEQLAALIYRTQQADGKKPMDILADYQWSDWDNISDWAKSAVTKLTMQGIFRDMLNKPFNPQTPATRAEIAAILYRYLTAQVSDQITD
jgi:uncharacterized repeat protein (TIGR02543 family)